MESNPVQLFHHLALALLLFVFSVSVSVTEQGPVPSIRTDAAALLSFKKIIQNDPNRVLSGWQINRSPCNWYGVSCTLGRVTHLDLSGSSLAGIISFDPLSSLDMLSALNLSSNPFTVNSTSLLHLPYALQQLQLSSTGLEDDLLLNSDKVQALDLSYNNFTGSISGLRVENSCNSLSQLDLSGNFLIDSIPPSLSNCSNLKTLNLSFNMITGEIPGSLGELGSLQRLDLSHNHISGWIPSELGNACNSLLELKLSYNNISGSIPVSFSPCSWLQTLDLSNNNISGPFPDSILQNLGSLERLLLSYNLISGLFPASVSYCKSLKVLDLSSNIFSGTIPPDICPGAASLEELRLPDNLLEGEIPAQLSQCSKLKRLDVSINFLNGSIPAELGNLENLEQLIAWYNGLEGKIPPELGKCKNLKDLILNNNNLSGIIPVELFSCSNLEWISLTSNQFTGKIPREFGLLSRLAVLQLANNSLSGEIPTELGNCSSLVWLDLNSNKLTGKIPDETGEMMALQVLELAHNQLSGEIPASLGQLKNLGVFDASHNRLQGQIPDSFSNLSFLVQIDLSNNELTGEIPQRGQLSTLPASQYANNPGLCGVPLNPIVLGILISIASLCILVVWAIAMRVRHKEAEEVKMLNSLQASHAATTWKIDKEKEPLSINVATFQRQLRKLKFSQLIEATNGFSAASLIGCGGFGEVFKATLKDGSSVAIKKLIRLSCQGDREFMAEMETLGKIKHRNLVPLLGYCKIGEERLLVYEFMEFGSLEEMLHGRGRARDRRILTWDERKKIARGAAKGLCFLHHNCIPHIIHRDMKSSNVLLDHEMEARVSDFGMARLISALDTHLSVSTLAGTPGYVPPEYYQSFRCTAKGDVYSFGVVLLELLTGKRPTDKEDFGDTNLVGWVKMKVREGKQMEVIDPEFLS
ncbi:hypothetical protein D5086_016678, partial [Populus alba]